MKYFLYILHSKTADIFYTGISENPIKRLSFHNSIEKGFTSRYRPWVIVFTKQFDSKEEARKIEIKIKKWKSKKMILKIISGEISI